MARARYETIPTHEPIDAVYGSGADAYGDIEAKPIPLHRRSKSNKGRLTTHQFGTAVSIGISCAALGMLSLVACSTFFGWPDWFSRHKHASQLSLEELRNGTYQPGSMHIEWLSNGHNGEFLQRTPKGFDTAVWGKNASIHHIAPPSFKFGDAETTHVIADLTLNNDRTQAIVVTDSVKHWRHSSFSRYWVFDIETQQFEPLSTEPLSIASWNPDGKSIAYVLDHDIYVRDVASKTTARVTFDGGADVFNGIPDWVYEEEVFSGDSALWWSPSGSSLAYMRTNDSLVPKFPIPYFFSESESSDATKGPEKKPAAAYPKLTELKYPKPGFENPVVELWTYSPKTNSAARVNIPTNLDQPLITEVIWVGEQVIAKLMNRESDALEVWVVDPKAHSAKRSRSYTSEQLGGAWFEVTHNSVAIGTSGYIDTVDVDGYNHLAFFSPADSAEPKLLTSGKWEVDDSTLAVNLETRHVYFTGSKRSSIEHTLYRVSLDKPEAGEELVGYKGEGVYHASFSADASYALVSYTAPEAPLTQQIISLPADLSQIQEKQIEKNEKLLDLLKSRHLVGEKNGGVRYGTVSIGDDLEVNYREILPSKFNPNKKHPLLFFNYGGPGSQTVQRQLALDFQRVYAEQHDAVVVTVDPRGTAKRGRKFRASVRDHLGEFEADDVIAVAKIWNQKSYIDESTTAIWGWSYGGFLTLKTLERDLDLAFKYGVAVAPVTDWAFYDSIYTERYMHTPQHNPNYQTTSISNVTNLARHERFLVMHGTGDDNVHFQNTLSLLDKLDIAGVENYDVHVFPDSDHSIYFHNANTIVYDKINEWLSRHQVR